VDILQRTRDVRFGSIADVCTAKGHVCFTPESGHVQCTSSCLLWANNGHRGEEATAFEDSYLCNGHTANGACELYLLLIIDLTMPANGTLFRGRPTAAAIHVAPLRETVVSGTSLTGGGSRPRAGEH
jgi:hypothetical protein